MKLRKNLKLLKQKTKRIEMSWSGHGKEVGKVVGRDVLKVTQPFVDSFKRIPGVQTLGNVGKTTIQ